MKDSRVMGIKQAILVVGAESSGTRFLTSIFIAAGCCGESTHEQQFDRVFPTQDRIVWRRSFPYGNKWPNVERMIKKLRKRGYEVKVAVMSRDWYCTARSQRLRRHAKSEQQAYKNIQVAYQRIFDILRSTGVAFVVVSYESLLMHTENALRGLMSFFELETPTVVACDANRKHFHEMDSTPTVDT